MVSAKEGHNGCYIFIIILTFILYVGTIFLNTASTLLRDLGWFTRTFENTSRTNYIEVTPSPWTFSAIWTTIYVYQAVWLLYGLSTICRRNSTYRSYIYNHPNYMPIGIYIAFSLNLIANSAWLFVFDREYLGISLGLLIVTAVTLYIAIGLSLRAVFKEGPALLRMGHEREIGLARGLVQNGMAFYATWLSVATHLGLAIVLAYVVGMDQKDASTIILGMLGILIILYSLLDMFAMDKYSRYMITPYIVLIVAFSGSLDKQFGKWNERNFIITAVLLGLSSFAFLFKLVSVLCKCRTEREPIKAINA